MPRILENDAYSLAQSLETMDATQRAQALDILTRYRDQQSDLGEPQWPKQEKAAQDYTNRLRGMFKDIKTVDSVAPSLTAILPYSQNPDADRARVANTAYMAQRYGKTPEEISAAYDLYRNDYAQRFLQAPTGLDDLGFHKAAAQEIQKTELKEGAELDGIKAAFRGDDVVPALQAWQQKNTDRLPDSTEFRKGFLHAQESISGFGVSDAVDAYQRAMQGAPKEGDEEMLRDFEALLLDLPEAKRKTVLTAAAMMAQARSEKAVKGIGARESGPMGGAGSAINTVTGFFQEVGESGGRFAGKLGGIAKDEELDVMANLPALPLLTDAAKARHPLATGVAYTSTEKIDTAEKAGDFLKEWKVTNFGTASADVTRADIEESDQDAKKYRQLDDGEKKLIEAAQKRELKKNQIARELRAIAESSDPVGPISGAIGSSVAMAAANILTRGKTLPISWQLYSEANYDQLRLENPSLAPSEARAISRVSGAGEAALDALGIGILRKLPSVAAVLKSGTSAAWRNAGTRLGATFAFEQFQEGVQDLTLPFTRALFEAVGRDTGLDMTAEWERWKDSRGTVAIASIPLILLGAGIATHQDIKDAKNSLSSRDRLGEQGISEADAVPIIEAARAGKMDEAQALYRDAFKRRSPEVAAEYQAKLETQQKAVAEAVVEVTRLGLIPEYTLLPGGKVVVTDLNDGSKATFDSWRDAQPVIEQSMNEMERLNNDSILRIADDILQRGEEVTVSPRSSESLAARVRGGSMSPEEAIRAAIAANIIKGVSVDEARKIAEDVFGESREERIKVMRDAVERSIVLGSNVTQGGKSKSKLFKGANLTTLIEETSEGRLKEGLRIGRYKKNDWLRLIQQAEEATGEKFLIGSTSDAVNASPDFAPRELVEAVSRIVVADVLGRLKDGRRIGSGSITKSLEENNSLLVAWIRAFKRLLASVLQTAKRIREARKLGKLGDEYDAYIDDLLGVDQQAKHETAVADAVAAEMATPAVDQTAGAQGSDSTNADGSIKSDNESRRKSETPDPIYSEENPGPNGETFSISSKELRTKIEASPDNTTLGNLGITEGFHANNAEGVIPDFAPRTSKQGRRGQYAGFYLGPSANEVRQYGNNVTTFPLNPATPVKVLRRPGQVERITPEQIAAWNAEGFGVVVGPAIMASRIEIATLNPGVLQGETFSLSRATPADASNVVQMPDGARLVGPTTFSIRAFHGTPHKVDRFSLDKIGTGEGAQAYGWGLYFAESREVGEGYRDKLAQWTLLTSDGKIYDDRKELKNLNVRAVLNKNGSIEEAIARAKSVIESIPGTQGAELALADIATLEKLKQSGGLTKTKGNLYTVELLPDADEFLDWDKPLSEQSEKVRKAVGPLIHSRDTVKEREAAFAEYDAGAIPKLELSKRLEEIPTRSIQQSDTGAAIYQRLWSSQTTNGREASEFLASIGIPGIRYLDGQSRDGGSGTSNFVIFDESLVKILEENGKPVGETFSLRKFPVPPGLAEAAQKARGESSLILAYQSAQRGSSSVMVPIRAVYEAAKKASPSLTPAAFMEQINALNDSGKILVGLSETMKAVEAAGEFRVGGAGTEMAFAPQETFSVRVTPAQDADYLAAVQAGDMEKAQRMVDKAAKAAGYDVKAWHVTNQRFTKFNPKKAAMGGVFWFTTDRGSIERDETGAGLYPGKQKIVMSVFLFTGKVAGRDEYERKGLGELSRDYNSVELEGDYIIFNPNQIKSADPVTRDEAGNVIPLSQRFNPSRDEITYSLRSGDFSSRMAAAFSPFQRSPELRRLMGKLAHDRVMRLAADLIDKANVIRKAGDLEREARTREAVKADELIKSGMKEADARKEAKRQVSEWLANARKDSGSAKAQRDRLKAWLRTLDAILSAAPAEVRAKVGGYIKLAGLATDEAMLKEIENRIAKLDVELSKWLKKEYLEQIAKLFKRFAPKKDDKGRITSSITAEAAEDIGFAFEFASLDDANQEKEMVALEKTLEESEDAAEIQDAIGKLAIANLFHKLEEREASELEAAALWLEELGSGAREARKIIDAARAEWVKEAKDAAKADAANGRLSSLPDAENVEADARSSTFKRFTNDVKGFLNSALFTMGQQLEIVFGQDSRITTEFHRRAVRAANDSTDIKRDIEARREAFVADLFGTSSRIKQAGRMGALTVPSASGVIIATGGKAKTIDVPADVILRIIEGTADLKALGFTKDEAATLANAWADNAALPVKRQKRVFQIERRGEGKDVELTMSQDEAIQYLLWSNQKASREQMERDGWSEESFQQLNAFLSDDAKALASFFADEYARMGRLIEPVYRRMFNAPFPQVDNYSPIFRDISKADSIIDIDQQGHGSGVSSGFILARNKNARSALRRTSAISAFMQHAESAAHWIAHVELVRDLRSVLIDKEVQNAIRSSGRTAAANGIKKRVMQLENQGKVGAAGIAELDSWGSRLLQARAFKGLAWRISPVMKQASAYFNPLLADVPAWDYMRGTARLLSGQLDVSAMWNSPDIQRRIEMGFSAESRIAMDKLGYTGSTLLAAMGKGMLPMTLMDAGWTTAGAAIAFDYYRRNNVKSGMNEAQAESAALDQLEMMIAESAQPADPANRSLIEGLQNPWLKSMWMFASESRKTLAVEIMALRRLATGKSKNKAMDVQRAVVAHVVMATTTQLMAGILSLLMGDDDDREREWSVEEWASAIVAGPINGLFLFGDAFNYIGRRLFGLHAFEPSTAFGQAIKTVSYAPDNLDKVINGDPEEQRKAFLRLSEAVGQAAALVGPGNPFTAADVILGNPLRDLAKALGD